MTEHPASLVDRAIERVRRDPAAVLGAAPTPGTAGLLDIDFDEYPALARHPSYGGRMREHGRSLFGGALEVQFPF